MKGNGGLDFPDWKKYIVHDFYGELKKNHSVINYPHFRVLNVIDEKNTVVFCAILEKPINKNWKYILLWMNDGSRIEEENIIPFRATKKSREIFNKRSSALAYKFIEYLKSNHNN